MHRTGGAQYTVPNKSDTPYQGGLIRLKEVTTRGGKMTSEAIPGKEINETGINKNEPPRFEQDVQEKPHDFGVKNKSSSIRKRSTQPLVKP
ncbi:hypothetical protein Tco_0167742 [Tanacetum coccineum]